MMGPPRLPPRQAGLSRVDLSQYGSGAMPAVRADADPIVDHESRIRELEASRIRQGERLGALESQLVSLSQTTARDSDVEELKAARASELELDRKNEEAAREGERLRLREEAKTRRDRRWAIFILVLGSLLGVGGKVAGDYWTGEKAPNAPLESEP